MSRNPTPVSTICNHCQNAKATKIVAWTVHVSWPNQHDAEDEPPRRRLSEAYCDECAELELANHHRDEPMVEAL